MKNAVEDPDMEALISQSHWMEGFALAIAGDSQRAADALQDTWVALLEGRMHSSEAPSGWMRSVLVNFVKLGKRRDRALALRELGAARSEVLDGSHGPFEIVQRAESQRRVLETIVGLAEPYRSTLLMRYMDELTAEEIGQRQGLPSSTVRNRIKRGLAQVRVQLGFGDTRDYGSFCVFFLCAPFFNYWKGVLLMSNAMKGITVALVAALTIGVVCYDSEIETPLSRKPVASESGPAEGGNAPVLLSSANSSKETEVRQPLGPASEEVAVESGADVEASAIPANRTFLRRLRVLGLDKQPVPDAELTWAVVQDDGLTQAETDLFGCVDLWLAPGQRRITIFKQDVGIAEQEIEFSSEAHGKLVELFLVRPLLVHGIVQGSDGSPLAGALITIKIKSIISGAAHRIPPPVNAISNTRGRFELQLDARQSFELKASHQGQSTNVWNTTIQSSSADVVLTLMDQFSISGTVMLPGGLPAAGDLFDIVEIDRTLTEEGSGGPDLTSLYLDQEGAFSCALAGPGSYRFTIVSRTAGPYSEVLELLPSAPRGELNIILDDPVGLAGVVRWDDGTPAAECSIIAWPTGGTDPTFFGWDFSEMWFMGYPHCQTDTDGAFVLEPLDGNLRYSLGVQPPDAGPEVLQRMHDLEVGTLDLEITLNQALLTGGQLMGSIALLGGGASKRELAGIEYLLHFRDPSEEFRFGRGSPWDSFDWRPLEIEAGVYNIVNLVYGKQYAVLVRAPGRGTIMLVPWIVSEETAYRDILMPRPSTLEVTLLRSDGSPAPHARFQLFPRNALTAQQGFIGEHRGDANGVVRFENIIPAAYFLSARGRRNKEVVIREGAGLVRVSWSE